MGRRLQVESIREKHKATPQSRQSIKLFLQSSELGLPQPLTRRRVCLPPVLGGGAHSLARGLGESQFRRGHTLWYSLYIYTYFVGYAEFVHTVLPVLMGWQFYVETLYWLWRAHSTVHPFCYTSRLYRSTCQPKHGPPPSADYSQPHAAL
jgi:hypothetical protein